MQKDQNLESFNPECHYMTLRQSVRQAHHERYGRRTHWHVTHHYFSRHCKLLLSICTAPCKNIFVSANPDIHLTIHTAPLQSHGTHLGQLPDSQMSCKKCIQWCDYMGQPVQARALIGSKESDDMA